MYRRIRIYVPLAWSSRRRAPKASLPLWTSPSPTGGPGRCCCSRRCGPSSGSRTSSSWPRWSSSFQSSHVEPVDLTLARLYRLLPGVERGLHHERLGRPQAGRAAPAQALPPARLRRTEPQIALTAIIVILAVSIPLAFLINWQFGLITVLYFVTQIAYTFLLKHMVIIDVMIVASGFVIRAMAGALAIEVPISPWLYVCVTLLALFQAISKRRHELILLSEGAGSHRKILEEYSPAFLDQMISVVTASTVIAYALTVLAISIFGIIYAFVLRAQILRQDKGTPRMQEVWGWIKEGANAYLSRQFRTIVIMIGILTFVLAASVLIIPPTTEATEVFGAGATDLGGDRPRDRLPDGLAVLL